MTPLNQFKEALLKENLTQEQFDRIVGIAVELDNDAYDIGYEDGEREGYDDAKEIVNKLSF